MCHVKTNHPLRPEGYHVDPCASALKQKLEKLTARATLLEEGVINGDIDTRREFYICMQKIEVTQNRLKNSFHRLESASIAPAVKFLHIR